MGYRSGYNIFVYVGSRPLAATDPLGLTLVVGEPVIKPIEDWFWRRM